jgi:hypothetical protein
MRKVEQRMDKRDKLHIFYDVHEGTTSVGRVIGTQPFEKRKEEVPQLKSPMKDPQSEHQLTFRSYYIEYCRDASDILPNAGLPPFFDLKASFKTQQRLSIAIVTLPQKTVLNRLLSPKGSVVQRPDVWSISEAKIKGGNLQNMEFRAVLDAVTLQEGLFKVKTPFPTLDVAAVDEYLDTLRQTLDFDTPAIEGSVEELLGIDLPFVSLPSFSIPSYNVSDWIPSTSVSDFIPHWLTKWTVNPPKAEEINEHLSH